MLSVHNVEFLELWDRLLSQEDITAELSHLDKLIESGLDVNEKLPDDKTLLNRALNAQKIELLLFLVQYATPEKADIHYCANLYCHPNKRRGEYGKLLEEMLKSYEGEVDYWACSYHLEVFIGFGKVDFFTPVNDQVFGEIGLLPIEVEAVLYLTDLCDELDDIRILIKAGSPPLPCLLRLKQIAEKSMSHTRQKRLAHRYHQLVKEVKN